MSELPAPSSSTPAKPWLKVDFHLHAAEDPKDELEYSSADLLRRARALGFDAVAVTLHGHVLERPELVELAQELGLLLIPAAEARLEGADVVVLNVSDEEAQALHRFEDLAALRARRGSSLFVFAPHPFHVLGGSMGGARLREHMALFDAVELSHFHTAWLNPNRRAERVAREFGKPMLATSDAHRLEAFGHHYARVAAERCEVGAIFEAIRAGEVENVAPALSGWQLVRNLWWIFAEHRVRLFQARVAGH